MENRKKIIKDQLEELVEKSKNLNEPRSEKEQKMLGDIMSSINELNDYVDSIKQSNK